MFFFWFVYQTQNHSNNNQDCQRTVILMLFQFGPYNTTRFVSYSRKKGTNASKEPDTSKAVSSFLFNLIWAPMILLKLRCNYYSRTYFACKIKLKYEAFANFLWEGPPKYYLHLVVVLRLSALISEHQKFCYAHYT